MLKSLTEEVHTMPLGIPNFHQRNIQKLKGKPKSQTKNQHKTPNPPKLKITPKNA